MAGFCRGGDALLELAESRDGFAWDAPANGKAIGFSSNESGAWLRLRFQPEHIDADKASPLAQRNAWPEVPPRAGPHSNTHALSQPPRGAAQKNAPNKQLNVSQNEQVAGFLSFAYEDSEQRTKPTSRLCKPPL